MLERGPLLVGHVLDHKLILPRKPVGMAQRLLGREYPHPRFLWLLDRGHPPSTSLRLADDVDSGQQIIILAALVKQHRNERRKAPLSACPPAIRPGRERARTARSRAASTVVKAESVASEHYHLFMSNPVAEPALLPPADEATVRRHRDELWNLAARHGISDLRFASPGRLVGSVAEDRDALDTADFEIAARALLGAEVGLFSDRVLTKPNVSPDLVAARPL